MPRSLGVRCVSISITYLFPYILTSYVRRCIRPVFVNYMKLRVLHKKLTSIHMSPYVRWQKTYVLAYRVLLKIGEYKKILLSTSFCLYNKRLMAMRNHAGWSENVREDVSYTNDPAQNKDFILSPQCFCDLPIFPEAWT